MPLVRLSIKFQSIMENILNGLLAIAIIIAIGLMIELLKGIRKENEKAYFLVQWIETYKDVNETAKELHDYIKDKTQPLWDFRMGHKFWTKNKTQHNA